MVRQTDGEALRSVKDKIGVQVGTCYSAFTRKFGRCKKKTIELRIGNL